MSCYKTYCVATGDGQASKKLQYDLDSHMAGCWLSWCMHCLHQHYSHSLLHHTKIEFYFQIASFYDVNACIDFKILIICEMLGTSWLVISLSKLSWYKLDSETDTYNYDIRSNLLFDNIVVVKSDIKCK